MAPAGLVLPEEVFSGQVNAAQYLAQHFIHLQCDVAPSNCAAVPWGLGGSIIEVDDEWFMLTAGHCLQQVEDYKQQGCDIRHWHLDDTAGIGSKTFKIAPFNFDSAIKGQSLHDDVGLDLGMVYLDPATRLGAKVNGKVALGSAAWPTNRTQFDEFIALGIPQETITKGQHPAMTQKGVRLFKLRPVIRPSDVIAPPKRQFFEIVSGLDDVDPAISDIAGISGGPIFGIRRMRGQARYWLLGVQTGWAPKKRIMNGVVVLKLDRVFRYIVRELRAGKSDF